MDEKITLRFDKEVIQKAKCYSEAHGMSLSRLVEFFCVPLYLRIIRQWKIFLLLAGYGKLQKGRPFVKPKREAVRQLNKHFILLRNECFCGCQRTYFHTEQGIAFIFLCISHFKFSG